MVLLFRTSVRTCVAKLNIIFISMFCLVYNDPKIWYLHREWVSLHGCCHVAPPCCYSSPEWTNLAPVRTFHVFKFSGRPPKIHQLKNEEEEEWVAAVSYQTLCNVRSLQCLCTPEGRQVCRRPKADKIWKKYPHTLSTSLAIRFIGNSVSVLDLHQITVRSLKS